MKVMIDLETMGDTSDAVIVSIGACTFDHPGTSRRTMYARVDGESHVRAGGRISYGTVEWWMKQSEEARAEITAQPREPLNVALLHLSGFLSDVRPSEIWGNGADFDCVILQNAYSAAGLKCPWSFRDHACFRTLKRFYPDVRADDADFGTKHHALHDAVNQARRAEIMLGIMRESAAAYARTGD